MKVERLDRICIAVPDLEMGKKRFQEVLGLEFEFTGEVALPDGKRVKMALSNQGIELLEVPEREVHLRSFHFKVKDLQEAVAQVRENGIEILSEFSVGSMDEAVMDLFGLRGIFIDYPGNDPALAARGNAAVGGQAKDTRRESALPKENK